MQKTFEEIDQDRTGMISFDELELAFERNVTMTKNMTKQRLKKIMKNVDY